MQNCYSKNTEISNKSCEKINKNMHNCFKNCQKNLSCCCKNNIDDNKLIISKNIYLQGPTGATGPMGATGATGATGPMGTSSMLLSLNNFDADQNVENDAIVSITGTNFSNDENLTMQNNAVTISANGIYQVLSTVEVVGESNSFEFTITMGGIDYSFYVYCAEGDETGVATFSTILQITNAPQTLSLYNRSGNTVNLSFAELDVIKLADL